MKKLIRYFLSSALICLTFNQLSWAKDYTIDQLPQIHQEAIQQIVAKRVKNIFLQSHFRVIDLDQDFADKVFNRYLDQLDYGHVLLTQADIVKFLPRRQEMLAELKSGKLNLVFELYDYVAKKRFQRYEFALKQLQQPFNFASNETLNLKRDKQPWASNEQELDEYWRKRVLNDAVTLSLIKKTEQQIRENLGKRYRRIQRSLIQTKSEDVFQLFMNAFAREIDPHTSYLGPRSKRDFDSQMSLSFEGIGATLSMEDDYAVIRAFVPGGPAERSKQLVIGDKIIGVGQKGKPIEDVIGQRLDDIVDQIRGPKGTKIILEVQPDTGNAKPKLVELTRDTIKLEDQEAKSYVKTTARGKVGVIEIPSFYMGLTERVKTLLADLNKQQIDALVIDLRNDGGGSLSEVIKLGNLFVVKGPIVQVQDTLKQVKVYRDKACGMVYRGPMIVLVNRYSASASEIFAAAMQDYSRALIVGETTFGKGTVQISRNLAFPIDGLLYSDSENMGAIQYTIQKFYRINGGSTQLKGVQPDIEMTPVQMDYDTGERFLDNALPWDSIAPADYSPIYDLPSLLPQLKQLHAQRIAKDQEFNYLEQDIARYNELYANRYQVSLNRKQREQELQENEQRELERVNARYQQEGKKPLKSIDDLPKDYKEPDAILSESLEIAMDLAQMNIKLSLLNPEHNRCPVQAK